MGLQVDLRETRFSPKDTYRLKLRGWKNIFHTNGKQKKVGVAILISKKKKKDLKIKITRGKERHYIMIKGSIKEEDVTIVNIYAPNVGAPQYTRQTVTNIKGEINSNTIIGDFNIPLTPMDRSSKQKINKETQVLNNTLDEMDLIDIFRTFHSNAEEYTFFSSAHGTFSRIDHILGHKSNFSKFNKIGIVSRVFSNHNAMRLDINYKKKTVRNTNTWRLNNMFLNN